MFFLQEAESCRRVAHDYEGRPEAQFLIKVADAFEALSTERAESPSSAQGAGGEMLRVPVEPVS